MSHENVEVVRGQFDAASRGDFTAARRAFAERVILVVPDAIPTNAGTFRGRDAVERWFGDWFSSFADYRFEIEETGAVDERVFLVARHHGRGRASGAAIDWSLAYVFTVQARKIVRIEMYPARFEALKAVGLEG